MTADKAAPPAIDPNCRGILDFAADGSVSCKLCGFHRAAPPSKTKAAPLAVGAVPQGEFAEMLLHLDAMQHGPYKKYAILIRAALAERGARIAELPRFDPGNDGTMLPLADSYGTGEYVRYADVVALLRGG